ncbi:GNAT family N-acetyltransferase [Clostridium senegalense]|uniref:GNAT family N-acetyltransferase n=1 Tax=Clostridium senegalense TaxID=1465809 RepID=UPI00028853FF|nr:GNAT family protein [Clostridium senegalense]MBU5227078.1 GNAT family N-acetyltransferase [Clostridium senegalense]
MSFKKIKQPKTIYINDRLKLTKVTKDRYKLALPWYSNPEILYYSEGRDIAPYEIEKITKMYDYLSSIGELYFIEILENNSWKAIGDVTLSQENLPIVIGDSDYFGKGIGKQVVSTLINRAKILGLTELHIPLVYKYNIRSQKLFTSLGFTLLQENDDYYSYVLTL